MRAKEILAVAVHLLVLVVSQRCPGQSSNLLQNPSDPAARGPYEVGARFLGAFTARNITVEVWYPAVTGSGDGLPNKTYPIRVHLPPEQAKLWPASDDPPQHCACKADLPLDKSAGPFPVVMFVHGFGAFRTESLRLIEVWASRGFVVISADYPGIKIYDVLLETDFEPGPKIDQEGDSRAIIAEFQSMNDPRLSFLSGAIDIEHTFGMVGHSAGAVSLKGFGDIAQVLVPWAGSGVDPGVALRSVLVMGGANDTIMDMAFNQLPGYADTAPPKRLVAVNRAGHQVFSDLCFFQAARGGVAGIAEHYGMWQGWMMDGLATNGCNFPKQPSPPMLSPEDGWRVVNYATVAVLEETLRCDNRMTAALDRMTTDMASEVFMFKQNLTRNYR